jgi:Sigma-70 region 2
MHEIGPYLVGIAFWIFIGAAAVAGIVTDYKRRRGSIDVLRMAIEKGQQLDPAIIEKLTLNEQRSEQVDPVHVKLGGIITVAAQGAIRNLFRRMSRNPALADDLAQQAFVQAWKSIRTLKSPGAFGAWLRQLAVNCWLQRSRRGRAAGGAHGSRCGARGFAGGRETVCGARV